MKFLLVVVAVALLVLLLAALVRRSSNGGLVDVADELRTDLSPTEAESRIAPLLSRSKKIDVRYVMAGTYRLSYQTTSPWAVLIAIVGFPIGLVALWLMRTEYGVTVVIAPEGDGSLVRVFGRVHNKLAEGLRAALRIQLKGAVRS